MSFTDPLPCPLSACDTDEPTNVWLCHDSDGFCKSFSNPTKPIYVMANKEKLYSGLIIGYTNGNRNVDIEMYCTSLIDDEVVYFNGGGGIYGEYISLLMFSPEVCNYIWAVPTPIPRPEQPSTLTPTTLLYKTNGTHSLIFDMEEIFSFDAEQVLLHDSVWHQTYVDLHANVREPLPCPENETCLTNESAYLWGCYGTL